MAENEQEVLRMKTAVIYARYSSDAQSEQSIEGQVRVCKQFAEKNDLLIVDQYIDRALTAPMTTAPRSSKCSKTANADNGASFSFTN